MKLGLYSITYLGVWYRGAALTLEQFIARAREYGYDGIEIDGKRPHGNPLDLSPGRRLELRRQAEAAGLEIYAVAANNDFSSPIPEYREAQLAYVRELIALTADLGAPTLRMFAGWPGVTFAPSTETAAAGSPSKHSGVGRYDVARRIWAATQEGVAREQIWDRCREGLVEAARWAADHGVLLALQNHPPVVDNGADMLRMVREVGSPALKACYDAPLAQTQGVVDMRSALQDVGRLQVLSHFGGEDHCDASGRVRSFVRERDGSLAPEAFYADFVKGLIDIGYEGYIGYELCHPLPPIDGQPVGIEFADENARLAAEYMRTVLNSARAATERASLA